MSDEDHQLESAPKATSAGEDHPATSARNVRIGVLLFVAYLVPYAGFMGLNAFYPEASGWTPFGGVNLAILYGLGLILAAVAIAALYVFLCRGPAFRRGASRETERR